MYDEAAQVLADTDELGRQGERSSGLLDGLGSALGHDADRRRGAPTFGSLFAGIGGIDLGLERAGWECRFQVEWDAFCQRVLAKHWPDVPRFGDIHDVHGAGAHLADADDGHEPAVDEVRAGRTRAGIRGPARCPDCLPAVDLLAGGFPCQPFSVAGRQRGMEDDRWLWPEFARTIRELRPRFVLVENVPGLLVGGGMGAVLGDLAELGYDAEWESIPAAAVGAPHLRYRVWIMAYANESRPQGRPVQRERAGERAARAGGMADSDASGRNGGSGEQRPGRWGEPSDGGWWRTEPDVGRVASRLPLGLDDLGGRLDGHAGCLEKARATGVPRTERLRVLWDYIRTPEASSGSQRCALCGHPLSAMPCGGTCPPWYLGAGVEADEHVRCLREGVYSLLSPERGEDLLTRVPRDPWATGGEQAVARRVDRLRSLGNAVVPQVVEWIGRRLYEEAVA